MFNWVKTSFPWRIAFLLHSIPYIALVFCESVLSIISIKLVWLQNHDCPNSHDSLIINGQWHLHEPVIVRQCGESVTRHWICILVTYILALSLSYCQIAYNIMFYKHRSLSIYLLTWVVVPSAEGIGVLTLRVLNPSSTEFYWLEQMVLIIKLPAINLSLIWFRN